MLHRPDEPTQDSVKQRVSPEGGHGRLTGVQLETLRECRWIPFGLPLVCELVICRTMAGIRELEK